MPVITLFNGTFCKIEPVVQSLQRRTGFRLIGDADLIAAAGRLSGLPEPKIERAFSAHTSVFNKFTHERERAMAHLRLALAQELEKEDDVLIDGFAGQLIPRSISHVMRVCLIADLKVRTGTAAEALKVSAQEALKLIHKQDEDRAAWMHAAWNANDPWDPALYDMVLPTDKMTPDEIVAAIEKNAATAVVRKNLRSRKAVDDFKLAAEVEIALVGEGHQVSVTAQEGTVTLTIDKHVLMLGRLENELKAVAARVAGVRSVQTKVGPGFYQADIYRRQDFNMPSKILLVDDEREFVQTLSERLLMRDLGSAVAYDGESALEVAREDEPDVMILDLRMPGIDGIEVLRRLKATQPEIEVIILTGHGTEKDRQVCMELGAFAYLQKPVDVEVLSATIQRANEKINARRNLPQ